MKFYLSMFAQYAAQYMKTKLQYRSNIIVEFISDLMFQAVNLVFILVVFQHTTTLRGWSRDEMIFIYGFFLVPFALFASFFNIWDFNERYIVRGELDRILTRPLHSLYQIVLERMELEGLLGAITGLLIMAVSAVKLQLSFTVLDALLFIVFIFGGMLIYAAIFILLACISFWSDSPTSFMTMIYNIGNYGRYPVDIYSKWIKLILTWILPFAFVGVYPAAYFLRREEWYAYSYMTPIIGVVFFMFSIFVWNAGIRRYRGAGN